LASEAEVGPIFLVYLMVALISFGSIPFMAYFAFALWRATYILGRDGLHIVWGLRAEDIPMNAILWVKTPEQAGFNLPMPQLHWPGFLVGTRRMSDGTPVEYLAAQTDRLLLVSLTSHIIVISPNDPQNFLEAYHRLNELGSLTPVEARSLYPNFLLAHLWADQPARNLLLVGLGMSLLLFVGVVLAVPGRSYVVLHVTPDGIPLDSQPSIRLLLLPVLNGMIFGLDFLAGLYFYRKTDKQLMAYLLWISAALTCLLFLGAVAFILSLS
jgi:hypothetical protein